MIDPIPSILRLSAESPVSDTLGWPCCDVILYGFEWIRDTCGVLLKLRVPNLDHYLLMTCEWMSEFKIDLDTGRSGIKNAATPMTWDVTYTKTEDNRWKLHFDFANDGHITLECGLVTLEVSKEKCF